MSVAYPEGRTEIAGAKPAASADWRASLLLAWFGAVVPLTAVGVAAFALTRNRTLADLFFLGQDFSVVLITAAFMLALRLAPLRKLADVAAPSWLQDRPGVQLALLAGAPALLAGAGWFVVCHAYPLSMDEFMAGFDAAIFRQGHLAATLPVEWRAYAFPLQPQFLIQAPGGAAWASIYLPVNALLRAGFGLVGAAWAAGAVYAATAVVAVYALARRFWPERPDAAVVAAVLLATSSQLIVTAMTPYAMSAHLAFNLVWLWLFLQPGWRSQLGAMAVAALACGLHQVVFNPLFAAPFILDLWLSRRWAKALAHTSAYAAIVLFWILYWKFVLPGGGTGVQGTHDLGVDLLMRRVQMLLVNFTPASIGFMAKNLVRFVAWQNPFMPALALAGAAAAVRRDGTFRALIGGALLTLAVVWVLEPFQGHGWGYRYWHGFLGSFCLIAALGWVKLTEGLAAADRRTAGAAVALAAAFSLLVLLPIRSVQVSAMIKPYAVAAKAIARTPAEVVLVDPTGLFYAADLVRNDPWLRNTPKLMDLGTMTDAQVAGVCAQRRTALFDRREGLALGLDGAPGSTTPRMAALRALLDRLHCGERSVPIPS